MHSDMESQTSSLVSHKRQLVAYLQLTSLSGEDFQITVDLQEFDRFNEFQFQIVVRQCCQCAEHKGQMRQNAKAIRVPVRAGDPPRLHTFERP